MSEYEPEITWFNYEISEFKKFLNSLQFDSCEFRFNFNTPELIFFSENEKARYVIEIESPWRIICDNKILVASHQYPGYIAFDGSAKEKEYDEWKEIIAFLKKIKVKKINLSDNCDLTVEWENGVVLNVFNYDMDLPSFYFHITFSRIHIYFKKIVCSNDIDIFKIPEESEWQW